jgi:PAS domain S-box-containing protein
MIMETRARSSYPDSLHPGHRHPSDWITKPYSIVFTAVVLFILIFGIAVFLGWRQFETTRYNALIADKTTANLLADLILERNKATIGILQSYAHRPLFIDAAKKKNLAKAYRHLSDLKKNAEIDLIFVTDKRGILWANLPVFPEAIGKDLSYRDWYKGVSSHWKPYISTVFKLIVGDKPLAAAVCVPIFDEKGRPIGILANSERAGFIDDAIDQVPLSPYTTVNVIDRAGQILYSNRYSYRETIAEYPHLQMLDRAMKDKRQQIEDTRHEDLGKLYLTVVPIGDIGWKIAIERSLRDIYRSEFRRFIEIGAGSFLLFLLIIFFLIYLRKVSLFRKTEELLQAETRLRQGDEKLRALSSRQEAILAAVPAIIMEVDNNKVYTWANSVGREFFGEDVIGKEAAFYFEGEQNTYDTVRPLFNGAEDIIYVESWQRRRDGQKRLLAWWCRALKNEKGDVEGVLSSAYDITDRKQAEEEVRMLNAELEQRVIERTAQLEAANRELEAFSYSVSHDLRAPLRSIDGFSQALLEEYHEKLDDTGKGYLERVRKATKTMGFLIDDLLNLSRITRSEFQHTSVDLSHMVRTIAEEHQKNYPERAVEVTLREGIMVQGDPYLLKIVVQNLLDNAWKFTGKEAHPQVEFGTAVRDGKTVCFIRDNGVGFDMAYVGKLFGAFQRLHTKAEFAGTGIGLATVQRIIHRHGGQVWAEGEIGKGATFYFTLPSQVINS